MTSTRLNFSLQYEPVITPGNELNVHHVLIYSCKDINSTYDGVQGNCYERDRPLPDCYDVVIAWAIGGEVRHSDIFKNPREPVERGGG